MVDWVQRTTLAITNQEEIMDQKGPKETKGVPWADHNETESSPPNRNPDEYGDENPYQKPGEKVAEPRPTTPERESPDEGVEREQDR